MKKICNLVIGSTGFIGESVCRNIYHENDLYTISRNKNKNLYSLKHFVVNTEKFNDLNKVIKNLKKNYMRINVFFLAGESSVENSIIDSKNSINNSIISFHNIILLLKDFKSTIVFASSGSVYDSRVKNCFTEKDCLLPPSPYAAIKYASEGIAMSYCETFGMDIRIARIFSVFGESMRRFFIFDLITKFKNSKNHIYLQGSGNQERDYLHVDDVANGLYVILNNGSKGEVYNLCSGKPIKLKNLAEKIRKILSKDKVKIIWNKKETIGIRDCWYGKNNKIKDIGFECQNSFNNRLESTVNHIFQKLKSVNK